MAGIGGNPSAGFAGILHCRQFVLADVIGRDIGRAAEFTVHTFIGGVAEMAGIIGRSPAVLTCISHKDSP